MTEEEWLAATYPTPMWWHVEGEVSERRLRLVACACCRRVWHLLSDRRSKPTVEAAEQLADGLITQEQAARILDRDSGGYPRGLGEDDYSVARSALISHAAVNRAVPSLAASLVEKCGGIREQEAQSQTQIIRDIFGNPFRPVALDPAWLTSDVLALARGIYDDRAFDRMPILADALQDAGCTNDDLLSHCRDAKQLHVRGCWAVDLVLGKN